MPKTEKDPAFTLALKKFIDEGCGGVKVLAARRLGVDRQEIYRMLKGTVPLDDTKRAHSRILSEAGFDPATIFPGPPQGVTVSPQGVTLTVADVTVLENVLRYLLDLVRASRSTGGGIPLSPRGQELKS